MPGDTFYIQISPCPSKEENEMLQIKDFREKKKTA